jgi:hypothetical protein
LQPYVCSYTLLGTPYVVMHSRIVQLVVLYITFAPVLIYDLSVVYDN